MPLRNEYALSKLGWTPKPYARQLKSGVTLLLDQDRIANVKILGNGIGTPDQRLLQIYLKDCADSGRKAIVDGDAAS
jgi:hypothetical protein